MSSEALEFFAPCPRGLEGVCASEIREMGIRRVRPLGSGVAFFGTMAQGMRAALWSRCASRMLLVLDRVDASIADGLYAGAYALPWEDYLASSGTLCVDAHGTNSALRNTQFSAVRVKDAICDRFRDREGARPSVDTRAPDVRVNVSVHGSRATIALDLGGEALHRRGWRAGKQVGAPLKENLAAGMLMLAGWQQIAAEGGGFCDPLCGSGTLAIEAALMAGDVAPGIMRARWGFEGWRSHDADTWQELLDEADERAEEGFSRIPLIRASDIDPHAVKLAAANAKRAHVGEKIAVTCADVAQLSAAGGLPGLVACNPPYGERLSTKAQLPALYATIASRVREAFDGATLAVITSDERVDDGLAMVPEKVVRLFNGRIECALHIYRIGASAGRPLEAGDAAAEGTRPPGDNSGLVERIERAFDGAHGGGKVPDEPSSGGVAPASRRESHSAASGFRPEPVTIRVADRQVSVAEPNSEQFAARLAKVYKRRRKWARKNQVSCYRVYDADLPDYNVAIDLYQGAGRDEGKRWVHVAEYAPPAEVDPGRAARRLSDVLAVAVAVFDVSPGDVFVKVRKNDGEQYTAQRDGRHAIAVVEEDFLRFEVNLSDYLDTGLFLDHRPVRELVFEQAEGTRFLNLFAYTGTASVHAAAGGARSTTTVDLSQTYLEWARRNMARNGFSGDEHEFVRADCMSWVTEQRHGRNRWDLIYVDPPTFSNSSSTGRRTFDVQRDHVELLIGVSRLLARGGHAIFSCNLRTFKPDLGHLQRAGVRLRDITAQTIPEDFERNPKIHHCYILTREAT